jgi:hypothetical protein
VAGDIEKNVEVHASVSGFDEAASEVEHLEGALEGLTAAEEEAGAAGAEAGAEISGGMDAAAASAAAAKKEISGVRDASAESAAAADLEAASTAALSAARKEAGAQASAMRKASRDLYADAGKQIADIGASRDAGGNLPKGSASGLADLEKELGTYRTEAEKADKATADLGRDIRTTGLTGSESFLGARQAIDDSARAIEDARKAYSEAAPYIDQSGEAIAESGRQASIAKEAMDNWRGSVHDFASGHGDAATAIRASRELDGVLGDFGRTTEDATRGLGDLSSGLEDAGGEGESFISSIGGLGGFGGAFGKVGGAAQSAAFPAAIVGIASAITTIGPALAATGLGFASWGALAAPAILKVKDGLTNVTAAQQAYQKAAATEAIDPTKAHAASEKAALDSLKATWATIPADVRPSVKAVQGLESAFSKAGKPIQADALKDIPKAIKDIKGLLPAVQGLAKATNPLISGMLKDFGKFEKSTGFEKFISNIKSEIPGLAGPLKQVGNAFGAIATALFSKGNVKIGDQFLSSLGGFAKEFGPGTVKSLGSVAKDLSTIMNVTTKAANSPVGKAIGDAFNIAGKVGDFSWKTVPKAAARAIGDTGSFGASTWDKLLGIKPGTNLGAQARIGAAGALKGGKDAGDVKIKVSVDGAAKAKADIKGLDSAKPKPVKIKVDTEGADKAKADLKGVSTAAQAAGKTKTDLKVQVTGAQAAESSLKQVGTAGTAMGTGVAAGAGRASAAVSAMAGSMRGAIAPLPGDFRAIGTQAGAGLAAGLAGETGAVSSAAASLAAAAETAANIQLIIKSPSKKFQKIGENSALGYILGLLGGKSAVQKAMRDVLGTPAPNSTIKSTVTAITKEIDAAAKAGKINPLQQTGLTQLLDLDNQRLQKLAAQRQKLENQIQAADALAKSVQQAAVSSADLNTIAAATPAGQAAAADDGSLDFALGGTQAAQPQTQSIQQGLQAQLKSIQQFRQQIIKLKKDGLDKQGIQELLAAGVQSGGATATQILAGGKKAVQQIAQLDNSIGLASKKLGITGGNAAYESASQIGGALAAGLKASLKGVNAEMESIAKSLVTGIMTALGDSSKQIKAAIKKLDKELGIDSGSGSGSSGKKPTITPPHIIYSPKPEKGPGGFAQPGPIRAPQPVTVMHPAVMSGATGGSSQPINVTLNATITVSGQTLANVVQTATLKRNRRNVSNGLTLPNGH